MAGGSDRSANAFARHAWPEVHAELSAYPADELDAADAERLAVASYLVGDDDQAAAAWELAHRRHAEADAQAEAARCAFWLALSLMLRGQVAHAQGWLARCEATLAAAGEECAASGYILIPALLAALDQNDATTARALAARAGDLGRRFGDAELRALASLGEGQALIALGDTAQGVARLDETMVAVTGGEVGPIASGIIYCAVITECMQLYDLARAAEWTEALSRWCDAQPGLVPYRGQCLVHQAQVLQAEGAWRRARTTIESARVRLTDPPHPALGLACYQEAELCRLAGDFDAAESAYLAANRAGHPPMPGLALLSLARGDVAAASAAIGRALQETAPALARAPLLAAAVDIYVAGDEREEARAAAEELATIAHRAGSDVLRSLAGHASGAARLAAADAVGALPSLRAAAAGWQRLAMPYEAARAAVLIGQACRVLGDHASADLEFDTARAAFAELGAVPDLEALTNLRSDPNGTAGRDPGRDDGHDADRADEHDGAAVLSGREREVLTHVARGLTNREIAAALVISQHTVSRHLENIYAKLGVSSRAAATAWAFEHGLL